MQAKKKHNELHTLQGYLTLFPLPELFFHFVVSYFQSSWCSVRWSDSVMVLLKNHAANVSLFVSAGSREHSSQWQILHIQKHKAWPCRNLFICYQIHKHNLALTFALIWFYYHEPFISSPIIGSVNVPWRKCSNR